MTRAASPSAASDTRRRVDVPATAADATASEAPSEAEAVVVALFKMLAAVDEASAVVRAPAARKSPARSTPAAPVKPTSRPADIVVVVVDVDLVSEVEALPPISLQRLDDPRDVFGC